ncbi:MAG: adenosine deaminase [Chloroflexi bacterium]|jgi:adenosine deaminase|nr:adenosine deaminase [Chloroflexota bacterium]
MTNDLKEVGTKSITHHQEHARGESLREWALDLPKIDLHRHIEGSLRLNTLADIATEHGIDLPSYDVEQLRPYVQMTDDAPDFHRFLEKFQLLRRFYTSKEAVQRIVREAVLDAASDNIKYLELRFNPVALARIQNFPLHEVVEWVEAAVAEVQEVEGGIRTCLILQIGREEPMRTANEIVDIAIDRFGPLVRGIDLAGDEVNYPAHLFTEQFRRAREAGLNITAHAGEAVGARSVHEAIKCLGAQRIGHGIRAVENSDVVRLVYENEIALEVCPTSNIHTGVVRGLNQHPLIDLFNLRLRVTINTDDPSVSATTLSNEYVTAITAIGLQQKFAYRALRHAVDAAFIPPEEQEWLRDSFHEWLAPFPEGVEIFDADY